jgi:hypothetical protein
MKGYTMNKPTRQVAAGYKAAFTRKIQKITERVVSGELTVPQAAGFKAAAKRRLNNQLAA